MAKKDKNKATFNNPFSSLKGLSVLNHEKPSPAEKKQASVTRPESLEETIGEDEQFAQAMGQLGVRQADPGESLERPEPGKFEGEVSTGPMHHKVSDSLQGGARRQARKTARRMGEPEATLDLHGVAAADAIRKVEWFLDNAVFHRCRVVRIVTGKGAHSQSGPILRPLVENYLVGPGRRFVVQWLQAPKNLGGEGALIAELYLPDESV